MYKNEILSGLGLTITQHVIGSTLGGIATYQIGMRHFKLSGGSLVACAIFGALIGGVIQAKIEMPKL
jgi:hypothetical protein